MFDLFLKGREWKGNSLQAISQEVSIRIRIDIQRDKNADATRKKNCNEKKIKN